MPHAPDCINRYLVGRDSRTAHYRVNLRDFQGGVYEFGEQVFAKPKRKRKSQRKKPMVSKWYEGTWVGYDEASHEHVVIIDGEGPAIKVRTVKPRMESQRWSAAKIKEIKATPDAPNPRDVSQMAPKHERETKGLDFGAEGGTSSQSHNQDTTQA